MPQITGAFKIARALIMAAISLVAMAAATLVAAPSQAATTSVDTAHSSSAASTTATISTPTMRAGTTLTNNYQDCPNGWVCLWGDSNYSGRYVFYLNSDVANVGNYMNDLTTSIWNRSSKGYNFYDNTNFDGFLDYIPAGNSTPNIGIFGNDRISSLHRS